MDQERQVRRLTTILAADVVGFSRLMGTNECGTLSRLKALRKNVIEPKSREHGGRTVKLMGDGVLMEFPSVVDAVKFAVDLQAAMEQENAEIPEECRIVYRIGINIGDIIVDGDDIYGDGVNIAARLEALAEPGGVCVSRNVFNQVKNKIAARFENLGLRQVKNIAEAIEVYSVTPVTSSDVPKSAETSGIEKGNGETDKSNRSGAAEKPAIAVLPFDNMSCPSSYDLGLLSG